MELTILVVLGIFVPAIVAAPASVKQTVTSPLLQARNAYSYQDISTSSATTSIFALYSNGVRASNSSSATSSSAMSSSIPRLSSDSGSSQLPAVASSYAPQNNALLSSSTSVASWSPLVAIVPSGSIPPAVPSSSSKSASSSYNNELLHNSKSADASSSSVATAPSISIPPAKSSITSSSALYNDGLLYTSKSAAASRSSLTIASNTSTSSSIRLPMRSSSIYDDHFVSSAPSVVPPVASSSAIYSNQLFYGSKSTNSSSTYRSAMSESSAVAPGTSSSVNYNDGLLQISKSTNYSSTYPSAISGSSAALVAKSSSALYSNGVASNQSERSSSSSRFLTMSSSFPHPSYADLTTVSASSSAVHSHTISNSNMTGAKSSLVPSMASLNVTGSAMNTTRHTSSTAKNTTMASIGSANNPDWLSIPCDYGSLTNAANDPYTQWNDSGAAAAWNDMLASYNDNDYNLNFADFVANYFHTKPSTNCGWLDWGNCDGVSCGQSDTPNYDVDSPAGYIIFNSMVDLHSGWDNLYDSIQAATSEVGFNAGNFSNTFYPLANLTAEYLQEKQAISAAQTIIGIALSVFVSSLSLTLPWFVANPIIAAQISATIGTSGILGFGFISNTISAPTDEGNINDLSSMVSNYEKTWDEGLQNLTWSIFTTPDDLYSAISDGKWFGYGQSKDEANANYTVAVTQAVSKAMYANLLPVAWNGGGPEGAVVFIANDAGVGNSGGGCEGWDPTIKPPETPLSAWDAQLLFDVDDMDWNTTRFCVGDDAYWIVSFNTGQGTGPCQVTDGQRECGTESLPMAIPQGWDTLTSGYWSGLSADEVFWSAYNTWIANDKNNTFAPPNFTDPNFYSNLESGTLNSVTGLINLPICSLAQASAGLSATYSPNYPCPIDTTAPSQNVTTTGSGGTPGTNENTPPPPNGQPGAPAGRGPS